MENPKKNNADRNTIRQQPTEEVITCMTSMESSENEQLTSQNTSVEPGHNEVFENIDAESTEELNELGVYTDTTTHGLALQDLFNYMVMTEPYENNPLPFLEAAVESGNSEGNQNNASELAEELYLGIVDDDDNNEIWDNNYSTLPDEVLEYTVCRDNTTNEQKVITQRKTTESCGYKLTPNMYKGIESDTDIDTETDTDTDIDTESERDSSETESTDNPNDYISDELLYAYAQSIQDLLNQTPETKPNDERKLSSLETGVDSVNNEVKQNNPSELAEQLHAGNAGDCDNNKTSDNNYSTLSDKLLENNVCRDSTTYQQNEQKVITQMKTTETCGNKLSLNSNTDIDTDTDTESERDSSETESTDNPNDYISDELLYAYAQSIQDLLNQTPETKPNDERKLSSLETGVDSLNNEVKQNNPSELAEQLHAGNAGDCDNNKTSDNNYSTLSDKLLENNVCRDSTTYQQNEQKVITQMKTTETCGNKLSLNSNTDIESDTDTDSDSDTDSYTDTNSESYSSETESSDNPNAYEQSIQDMITLMKMTKPNDESKSPSSLGTGIDSGNNEMIQNSAPELAEKLHVGNAENNLRRKKTTNQRKKQKADTEQITTEPFGSKLSPFLDRLIKSGHIKEFESDSSESESSEALDESNVCCDNNTDQQKKEKVDTEQITTEPFGNKSPYLDTDIKSENIREYKIDSVKDLVDVANENYIHDSCDNKFQKSPQKHTEQHDYAGLPAYEQSIQDMITLMKMTKPNDESKSPSSLGTGIDSGNNEMIQNSAPELAEKLHVGNAENNLRRKKTTNQRKKQKADTEQITTEPFGSKLSPFLDRLIKSGHIKEFESDSSESESSEALDESNVCCDNNTDQQKKEKVDTEQITTEPFGNKSPYLDTDIKSENIREYKIESVKDLVDVANENYIHDSCDNKFQKSPQKHTEQHDYAGLPAYEQSIQDMITLMKMTKPNDESKSPSSLGTGIDSGNNEMIQNNAPELAEELQVGNAGDCDKRNAGEYEKNETSDNKYLTLPDQLLESNICHDNNTDQQKEEKIDTEQITTEPFGNKSPPYLDADIKSENIREYKIESVKDLVDVANENYILDSCDNKFQKSPQKHTEHRVYADLTAYEQSIQDMITLMKMTKPNDESKSPSSLETDIGSGNNEMIQNNAPELAEELQVGNAGDCDKINAGEYEKNETSDNMCSTLPDQLLEINVCSDNDTSPQKKQKVLTQKKKKKHWRITLPSYLRNDVKSGRIKVFESDSDSSDDECLEELTKNRASSPKELNAEVESEKSYENKQSSSDDNVDSSSSIISLTSDVSDEEAASESTGDKRGNKRKVTQTKSKAAKKMKRIIIEDSSDSESSSCFSYTTTEEECKANNMVKTKFIPPPAWLKPKYDCADMRLPELFLYLKRKLRAIDAEIKKFLKKSKKKQFRTRELKWKIRNIILDMKKVDDMSYSLAHYSIPVNFLRKVNENLACGLPVLSNIQRPIPEMTLHSKLCKVFLKCGWIFLKRTFPEEGYKCSLYRQIRK
ncbi:dentin sialophosphoprotein-like isoform X2 [Teleopsis dalmanni]|uniref:dentin sialophosphoprotein-like isoform X2 n=1 Tax=Teleopsis dalmanni TaxID=139649 RepID=UPI0018CDB638|nr:dentin sialophosphoprotein-like isoform X2 [Teleopsis dalmanni]